MSISVFVQHFGDLPDPRVDRTKKHLLLDVLVLALCATLCGVETWEDMEQYALAKQDWFRKRLGLSLPNGIPSDDTFRRIFSALDPVAFGACFRAWTQEFHQRTKGEVLALDGKTLRGSFDSALGQKPLHMVSAFACTNRLVLGSLAVDDKSNEIPAVAALLALLDLHDCIVTADAMHCQKALAKQIVDQGGDYVFCVKDNQPHLAEDVAACLTYQQDQRVPTRRLEIAQSEDHGHGRREVRRCACVFLDACDADWADAQQHWAGLRCLVEIQRTRQIEGKATQETRYYISSLSGSAKQLARAIRDHWSIENELHHVLDVSFHEDDCRVKRDHAPVNLAMMRHVVLNLLRKVQDKGSLKGKSRKAGWDNEFLLRVLVS
jgi:predicted transposase YbfD/YdcC